MDGGAGGWVGGGHAGAKVGVCGVWGRVREEEEKVKRGGRRKVHLNSSAYPLPEASLCWREAKKKKDS